MVIFQRLSLSLSSRFSHLIFAAIIRFVVREQAVGHCSRTMRDVVDNEETMTKEDGNLTDEQLIE